MTIESKEVLLELLQMASVDPKRQRYSSIYSFTGVSGKELFALFTNERYNDIDMSPFVKDPVLLWDSVNGLTEAGKKLLASELESS